MERSEELPRWRGRSGSRRDAMSFCFPAGHRTPWSPPMCVISRTHSGPRSVLPRFIHSPARKSPATAIVRSSSPHISFDTFITSAFPTMPGRLSPFLLLPRTLRPPNRSFPFVRDSGGFFFRSFFYRRPFTLTQLQHPPTVVQLANYPRRVLIRRFVTVGPRRIDDKASAKHLN